MLKERTVTSLALALAIGTLVGCVSNSAPQRNTNTRGAATRPDAEPLPPLGPQAGSGPTDPGTRYLPIGQPVGQIPVETPPFETSP